MLACQLINVEGMTDWENHHLAIIKAITQARIISGC